MSSLEKPADYVVVGAGPAGCVLAARLSEDPDCKVVLIEAGGRDWNPLLGVPLMTGLILRSAYANWCYVTEPEPQLNGRRTQWARGRVLGGSSSIHGMVYMRGLPIDFANWAAQGLTGWSYDEVLPYFLRSENSHRGRQQRVPWCGWPLDGIGRPPGQPLVPGLFASCAAGRPPPQR